MVGLWIAAAKTVEYVVCGQGGSTNTSWLGDHPAHNRNEWPRHPENLFSSKLRVVAGRESPLATTTLLFWQQSQYTIAGWGRGLPPTSLKTTLARPSMFFEF